MEIATEFGPRITGLRLEGGPQLFAELGPDVAIDHGAAVFRFRGGHRLWAAPEVPAVTYAPDEHECAVARNGSRVVVFAPPDQAGIVKELRIAAEDDDLVVEHLLGVEPGKADKVMAPWAITQLPPGGVAFLGIPGRATAPLPDRQIVLWPYTKLSDPRIQLGDDALMLEAGAGPDLKLGVGPVSGALGYFREGWLFLKERMGAGRGEVPDLGAVGQVFVGQGFCELETVGSLETVSARNPASLIERWRVVESPDWETAQRVTLGGLR